MMNNERERGVGLSDRILTSYYSLVTLHPMCAKSRVLVLLGASHSVSSGPGGEGEWNGQVGREREDGM